MLDQQQALLSYLGNVPHLVDFRRAMLDEHFARYQQKLRDPGAGSSRAGAGLLVLQHAFIIAEDFAAQLYAHQGSAHWSRLTSYSTKDISNFFKNYLDGRSGMGALWNFPQLSARQLANLSPFAQESWRDLVTIHRARLASTLELLAKFWLAYVGVGKGAFHGFCFMAEDQVRRQSVTGPFGKYVAFPETPFVLAVASEVDHAKRTVDTKIAPVMLDGQSVTRVHSAAVSATYGSLLHAVGWICDLRSDAVPLPVPVMKDLFLTLPPRNRAALEGVVGPWM